MIANSCATCNGRGVGKVYCWCHYGQERRMQDEEEARRRRRWLLDGIERPFPCK